MSNKSKLIGFRITAECDRLLAELAAYNKCTKSETIRRIFLYVPKLHAMIPEDKLKEIREKEKS